MQLGYPWLFSSWKAQPQKLALVSPLVLTEKHTRRWISGCPTFKKEVQTHQSTRKMPVLSPNRGCCGSFLRCYCILGKQMVFNRHLTLSMNWGCAWPYYVYVITHYICIYSRADILYLEEVSATCKTRTLFTLARTCLLIPFVLMGTTFMFSTFKLMC